MMNAILEQLETHAGVRPSEHWLQDCCTALASNHQSNNNNNVAVDAVLQQILHHDLRDVIRTFRPELQIQDVPHMPPFDSNNNDNSITFASPPICAIWLRRAMQASRNETSQCRCILPRQFRLMVQIEEFLDTSVNATTRLQYGPANASSAPTPVGNQNARCLKLFFTDGYCPISGTSYYSQESSNNNIENTPPSRRQQPGEQEEQNEYLIAMELTPVISQLSVNSCAGLKVLLHGPIQVRHGIMLLHDGNATVLGGNVSSLVKVQMQAIQQAQRVAGIGVDATIRALIGTETSSSSQQDDDNNNNDEGEEESRDLPVAPPPRVNINQNNTTTHHPPPMMPPPTTNHHHYATSSSNNNIATAAAAASASRRPFAPSTTTRSTTFASDTTGAANAAAAATTSSNISNHNPYGSSRSNNSQNISTTNTTAGSSSSISTPMNPYASTSLASRTTPSSSFSNNVVTNNTSTMSSSMAAMRMSNTSASTTSTTTTPANHPYGNGLSIQQQQQQQQLQTVAGSSRVNPYASSSSSTSTPIMSATSNPYTNNGATTETAASSLQSLNRSVTASSVVAAPAPAVPPGTEDAMIMTLSFDELRNLLMRIIHNESLYEKYHNRTFVVTAMQQVKNGARVFFDICDTQQRFFYKKFKRDKKKGKNVNKDHDYVLISKFHGPDNNDDNDNSNAAKGGGVITCKVSSAIQEPYFGMTPSAARKMSREDAPRAKELIRVRGQDLSQQLLLQPISYECTLWHSPQEFFHDLVNNNNIDNEDNNANSINGDGQPPPPPPPRVLDGILPILEIRRRVQ